MCEHFFFAVIFGQFFKSANVFGWWTSVFSAVCRNHKFAKSANTGDLCQRSQGDPAGLNARAFGGASGGGPIGVVGFWLRPEKGEGQSEPFDLVRFSGLSRNYPKDAEMGDSNSNSPKEPGNTPASSPALPGPNSP